MGSNWLQQINAIGLTSSARACRAMMMGQRCAACAAPCSDSAVCSPCTTTALTLEHRCPRCATPQGKGALCGACISRPPAFDAAVCVGAFSAPLSLLIAQFKFEERLTLAAWFARQLDSRLYGIDFALVVPVPLFDIRLAERGFNQAWEIAKRLNTCAPKSNALTRLRDTPSQRTVSAAQRFTNVRGAFLADSSVKGLHVLLVDDVVTTTATVQAASKALKDAGAKQVTVACIARVSD